MPLPVKARELRRAIVQNSSCEEHVKDEEEEDNEKK